MQEYILTTELLGDVSLKFTVNIPSELIVNTCALPLVLTLPQSDVRLLVEFIVSPDEYIPPHAHTTTTPFAFPSYS